MTPRKMRCCQRKKGWKIGDRTILDDDPLTQSGVWYDLREKYLIPNISPLLV
ncbi:MAG: hypothetical protein WBZ36_02685 [Candidatus Nitrosopolaris sp.]